MNPGECQTRVKASDWQISEALWEGNWHSSATMEFHGNLLAYNWKAPVEKLALNEVLVHLTIDFRESREDSTYPHMIEAESYPPGKIRSDYIGHIKMFKNIKEGITTSIGLFLPRRLLSEYMLFRSEYFFFQTSHDLIEQRDDNSIVALVRSAYLIGGNPD